MTRTILALAAALPLLLAAPASATSVAAAKPDGKAVARAFYEEVFNKHDLEAIDKYVAANVVDHSPEPGQKPGIAGVRTMFSNMLMDMKDMKVTVHEIVGEGEKVAARVTMTGTPTKAMMGMQPSGKAIEVTWLDWLVVKDGKVVEHWGYGDMNAMMRGYKPAPAGKPAHE